MRWNELGKFLIISLAIIGGFCVYISPLSNSIKQGLDLQGGTHVVLQAVDTPELKVDDDAVNRSVKIIERVRVRIVLLLSFLELKILIKRLRCSDVPHFWNLKMSAGKLF